MFICVLPCCVLGICIIYPGLQVCCGESKAPERHVMVSLPSTAALAEYKSINTAPPYDPAKFALRLLGVFFTLEQLSTSNCTKAEGRELLDPNILQAIKRKEK